MPVLFGVAGLLVGVLVGLAIGLFVRSRRRERATVTDGRSHAAARVGATTAVEIPAEVDEVLSVLRSGTIVLGPHDEVLRSSVQARTFGLVRGTRLVNGELLAAVRDVRLSRVQRALELEISRSAGAPVAHLAIRVAPIGNELVIVLLEDRTALYRVDQTRRDFVANVSHELKTPIGAIGLLAEAVEDAADDPDAVRRFAGRMSSESARLSMLVGQIIDLSRLQADDPMLRAGEVSVDDVITSALNRNAESAQGRGISLALAGERGCRVLGEDGLLVEAVSNLVSNAIAYSGDRARVAVAARSVREDGEDYVDIAVSDNGIGIAPENLGRIFERFYRVDYARSRANGGTGLGLSIVKHIASVHGGSVSVWSKLGEGSTFTIRLPALVGAEPSATMGQQTEKQGATQ